MLGDLFQLVTGFWQWKVGGSFQGRKVPFIKLLGLLLLLLLVWLLKGVKRWLLPNVSGAKKIPSGGEQKIEDKMKPLLVTLSSVSQWDKGI